MKYRMRYIVAVVLSCFLLAGCKQKEKPVDEAAQVALKCYNYLAQEQYDAYLQEMAGYEHMPERYRNELKALLAQYVRKEQTNRGGFSQITINSDTIMGQRANVFLQIEFKDGTKEEVAVPMIFWNKSWKLQ